MARVQLVARLPDGSLSELMTSTDTTVYQAKASLMSTALPLVPQYTYALGLREATPILAEWKSLAAADPLFTEHSSTGRPLFVHLFPRPGFSIDAASLPWASVGAFLDDWNAALEEQEQAELQEIKRAQEVQREREEAELRRAKEIEEAKERAKKEAEARQELERQRERDSVSLDGPVSAKGQAAALAGEEVSILFFLPGGSTTTLHCPLTESLGSVKAKIFKFAKLAPEQYTLKVPDFSDEEALTDDRMLFEIPYIEACHTNGTPPKLIVKSKGAETTNTREKKIKKEIGGLVGRPLCWSLEEEEMADAATQLQQFVKTVVDDVRGGLVPVNLNTTTAPMPEDLREASQKILIRIILFNDNNSATTLQRKAEDTVNSIIEHVISKTGIVLPDPTRTSASDYVLRICNRAYFLEGDVPIGSFFYVRDCLKLDQRITLRLLQRNALGDERTVDETSTELAADEGKRLWQTEIQKSVDVTEMLCIPIQELRNYFRVQIVGVDGLNLHTSKRIRELVEKNPDLDYTVAEIFVKAGLYHGDRLLCKETLSTTMQTQSATPRWNEWLEADVLIRSLPLETKVGFTLYALIGKDTVPLGWVNCQLINFRYELKTARHALAMWLDEEANPIATNMMNVSSKTAPVLTIEFQSYNSPAVFHEIAAPEPTEMDRMSWKQMAVARELSEEKEVERIINTDPLYKMTEEDKLLIWKYRHACKDKYFALAKFLISVNWGQREDAAEAYRLLQVWEPLPPHAALELLDAKFADAKVREYAVSRIDTFKDQELSDYLLQLVQVLKYEPFHSSALAKFLIRRALKCRGLIGLVLFWHLKAEMHVPEISDRYFLILEAYLRGCGAHRAELSREDLVINELQAAALVVKATPKEEKRSALQRELQKIKSHPFTLPLDPGMQVKGLVIEKCKYMDSKKQPLWLVFNNADPLGDPITVIFKSGDDLRQDLLTLQLIRIMDKLWQENGLDLEMSPYLCVATGQDQGFIEVVLNSDTISNIQKAHGGAAAAFRQEPLAVWLRKHNPTDEEYKVCVDRFVRSTAGYCVATYILGIGDRHNDNIMLTKRGNLFHIDFGHFLGNFKSKFGIKRERAPFVLTPDIAFVMGGKGTPEFNRFIELSCQAYNIVRAHSNVFINLFAMMLSTGIPELESESDIDFLKGTLSIQLSEAEATKKFTELIYQCLSTKATQINNFIHNVAH